MSEKKEKVEKVVVKEKFSDVVIEMNKEFEEGVFSYGNEEIGNLGVIPFGILSLDGITGIGGIAKGRISEIHGMDGSFKTTLALHLIVECQKTGGTCAFIDAEYAYLPEYAEKIGVDNDKLILVHPASAEEAYKAIEKLVDSKRIDLIVLDSLAALSPVTELTNDFGSSNMGVMARLTGQFFRKITAKVGKTGTALVILNQLREQLGGYVPMKTTPGGNAVRFYASLRLEISKAAIKVGTDVKGVTLKVKTVKNKLSEPYLITELEAIFGEGINKRKDMLNVATTLDIISKSGAGWLTYKDHKIQGIDNFIKLLGDNEELQKEIEDLVKTKLIK